ncbi:MAG: hypothetical protein ACTSRG_08530 [Candidatus Helarchaeota archaeon]
MKKQVLFTMKMKSEEERDKWQKYAKNRYGEPLSVVIRRLIEEDMNDVIPREYVKLEEAINIIREENIQNFKFLLNRLDRSLLVNASKTYEVSQQVDILKGLILHILKEFDLKNNGKIITTELIKKLEKEILKTFDNLMSTSL